jgi:hypothetical protein
MKTGIGGTLVLPLVLMILVMPGCTSIQDYWTIPDDQPLVAAIPVKEASSSGPADQDFAREALLEREEAEQVEAGAQEETDGQEEALLEKEEVEQVEAGTQEETSGQEEAQ